MIVDLAPVVAGSVSVVVALSGKTKPEKNPVVHECAGVGVLAVRLSRTGIVALGVV